MAKGRFSNPRPNREEDREIEQAFRQVTGQAPIPTPPTPEEAMPELEPFDFDLPLDEEPPAEETPPAPPVPPVNAGSAPKALLLLEQAVAFCENNRRPVLVALCGAALILLLVFMGIFFASTADPYEKTILSNVIVADVNVGGMTKDEAISAVKQATAHTYSQLDMVVDLEGHEVRLSPTDTAVTLDVKAAVSAAYDYGRTGTKAEKEQAYLNSLSSTHIIGLLPYLELNEHYIMEVLEAYAQDSGSTLTQASHGLDGGLPDLDDPDFDPKTAPTQTLIIRIGTPGIGFDADAVYEQILDAYSLHDFTVTVEGLDAVVEPEPVDLEAIWKEYYIKPVNATVNHQTYEVIPGTYGYGFDMEAAKTLVANAEYGEEIRIPMVYLAPTVLNEDMFFQDVLAEYETSYKDTGSLQTNLILACEAIDGTVINPGESFSFNTVVGQRTSAKGYKHALDQITEKEDRILGGGISQVSSALYYCALVADLNVTDRTSHAYVPGYSDYGLDAAVGWSSPDLRFINSLGLPIRIQASAGNGKVQITLMGTDEQDYYVAMDYEISGTKAFKTQYRDYDANNEEGYKDGDVVQEGTYGYVIKTYRMKYDDHTGELLSKDYVTTTQYQSIPKIIARVPEETTAEATEEATEETEETAEATEQTQTPTTQAPTENATEAASQPTTEAATEPPVTEATQPTTAATETVQPETTASTETTGSTEGT